MSYDHLVSVHKAIPKHVFYSDPVEHIDAVLERALGEVALKRADRERRESKFMDEILFSARAYILSRGEYRELLRKTRLRAKKELLARMIEDLLSAQVPDRQMTVEEFKGALDLYLKEIEEGLDP